MQKDSRSCLLVLLVLLTLQGIACYYYVLRTTYCLLRWCWRCRGSIGRFRFIGFQLVGLVCLVMLFNDFGICFGWRRGGGRCCCRCCCRSGWRGRRLSKSSGSEQAGDQGSDKFLHFSVLGDEIYSMSFYVIA